MPEQVERCLIVEDDSIISTYLATLVQSWGIDVCGVASTGNEAVTLAHEERPDVILMDVRLIGHLDGVDAAMAIHRFSTPRVIYITASREKATLNRINRDHPDRILYKPVNPEELRLALCG